MSLTITENKKSYTIEEDFCKALDHHLIHGGKHICSKHDINCRGTDIYLLPHFHVHFFCVYHYMELVHQTDAEIIRKMILLLEDTTVMEGAQLLPKSFTKQYKAARAGQLNNIAAALETKAAHLRGTVLLLLS